MSYGIVFQLGIPQTVIAQATHQGTIKSQPLIPPPNITTCNIVLIGNDVDVLLGLGVQGSITLYQWDGSHNASCTWASSMATLSPSDKRTVSRPGFTLKRAFSGAWFTAELDLNSPMNAGLQVTFN